MRLKREQGKVKTSQNLNCHRRDLALIIMGLCSAHGQTHYFHYRQRPATPFYEFQRYSSADPFLTVATVSALVPYTLSAEPTLCSLYQQSKAIDLQSKLVEKSWAFLEIASHPLPFRCYRCTIHFSCQN